MIELQNEHNELLKDFEIEIAQSILIKAERKRSTKTWRLPDDSPYQFKKGVISEKPKKEPKPKKEIPKEDSE